MKKQEDVGTKMIFVPRLLLHALAFQKSIVPPQRPPPTSLVSDDLAIIRQGGIYVHPNWLPADLVYLLRNDIDQLRSTSFKRSGLSNRVDGDKNSFGSKDRLTCTISPGLGGDLKSRKAVEQKLDDLRLSLMEELSVSKLEFAEHYYSLSPDGSLLPRHMDERHEETKGEKAWEAETRRSISWLLYLNDPQWKNGGELRAYCRLTNSRCGSHEGNLQVGWLPAGISDQGVDLFDPVFLDSWLQTPVDHEGKEEDDSISSSLSWYPLSALYRLAEGGHRDYITEPFGPNTPSWPMDNNLEPDQFAAALAQQVVSDGISGPLIGVESIAEVKPVDVLPAGGTLVLFDSATVPHEVLETTNDAERYAMAGWFHEPSQEFPGWYGT